MAIQYLPYQHIDKTKWDACIAAADNGLIYGYSFYLDAMAKHWDGLVLGDYEMVMPLTYNKKYGIHYLYQPYFTACLGIFGKAISAAVVSDFLAAIPSKFRYWDFYFNHGNYFQLTGFKLYERINYVLDLSHPYELLYAAFRDNSKRNIKKAVRLNCTMKKGVPIDDVIQLAMEQSKSFAPIKEDDYDNFKTLFLQLQTNQQAVTYGVYSGEQLIASCALFISHKRVYYILVGNHPNGKTIGASHALINEFIKDFAGRDLLLDFEGSDIRNLAFFYSSFGATEEKYAGIKLNRLPKILQRIKK